MDSADLISRRKRTADNISDMKSAACKKAKSANIATTKGAKNSAFKFDGSPISIRGETGTFDTSENKASKAISCNRGGCANLPKNNFIANTFKFPEDRKYQTKISAKNDELCANRAPMSETAHITAIIGAFTLAFTAIRRIKPKQGYCITLLRNIF